MLSTHPYLNQNDSDDPLLKWVCLSFCTHSIVLFLSGIRKMSLRSSSLEKRGERKDRNVVGHLELLVSVTGVLVHTATQHIT
jgi:hypothetical protein